MKAINIKLATFSFAALLLASCSDSNSIIEEPSIGKATKIVGSSVKALYSSDLTSRVHNLKGNVTKATRAYDASKFDGITSMPTQPNVPAEAIDITKAPGNSWESHTGIYFIKANTTFDTNNWGLSGATFYVEKGATLIWNAYGPNCTIYVLDGGKLQVGNSPVFQQATVYNYGNIEFNNGNEVIVSQPFYNAGNLDLTGKKFNVQNKCYIGGNLKANELANNWGMALYVVGDCEIKSNEELRLNGSSLNIGGKFSTAGNLSLNTSALFVSGCSVNVGGNLDVNSGGEIHIDYLSANNITLSSGSSIVMKDKSMINCAGTLASNNQDTSHNYLEGDNAVAVVKASTITFNNGAPIENTDANQEKKKYEITMFGTPGNNSKIILDGVFKVNNEEIIPVCANANIYPMSDENASGVSLPKTECNPGGYKDGNKEPEPEPEPSKPGLDLITNIDYDHTHEISATGIMPLNGYFYMSYHTNQEQADNAAYSHGGCVEVFTPVQNDKVELKQYLYDEARDLDFNHLLAVTLNSGERKVFLPGTSNKKGAMLAYMTIGDDHMLATESKQITTTETDKDGKPVVKYEEPLQYVQLHPATEEFAKKGYDENCVVYNNKTDHLIVATTEGYVIYDANKNNEMNEVASYSRPGKVKHVAIGDSKIVGLYLNDRTHGSEDAVDATIEVIDRDTEDFENSKTFSVSTNIQPNDGKNVVAVNDNKIYVCQSGLGLYVYDMDGNEVGKWQMPKAWNEKKGIYKALCNGCFVDDNYVYLAYGSYGIVVLDKNTLEVVTHRKTQNSANYITVKDGYMYVAYGRSRLQVFKLD